MEKTIQVLDKSFRPYISEAQIRQRVSELAQAITVDFAGKQPVFVAILNGAWMFSADLVKEIHFPCEMAFMKVSSYQGLQSSGKISVHLTPPEEMIKDRHVIIVEDIVDSGLSMVAIRDYFQKIGPASLHIVSFLTKPSCIKTDVKIDYSGFEIGDLFVVGYGLDYNGYGRNLADIYQIVNDNPPH